MRPQATTGWMRGLLVWLAATMFACSGGEGGVTISGPGPGSDEPPFPPFVSGGDTFGGNCEPLVSCDSLGATCGSVLDNCGNPLMCDNGMQDGSETDVDCGGGTTCETLCQQGRMCEAPEDCLDGFCTDLICCDEACDADCMTCEFGSCQPIQQDQPDPGVCEGTQACDGMGTCKLADGQTCAMDADCAGNFCDLGSMTCI